MVRKTVVVLGGTSFTGGHILDQLSDEFALVNVGRDPAVCQHIYDANSDNIEDLSDLFAQADFVINCISNGNVDFCEANEAQSRRVNVELVKELCEQQKKHSFHLIHFSSNAVYDGENPLYCERSPHNPINIYGKQKSEADYYLRSSSPCYTLLRPITMYGELLGEQRHNPYSFFLGKLKTNEPIQCVDDVYVNMLLVDDLVACVANVVRKSILGEYNLSGEDIVNRLEFVETIKKFLPSSTSNIIRTNSENFETLAARPRNTSFDNSKMKNDLEIYPLKLVDSIERLIKGSKDQNRSKPLDVAA